MTIEEMKARIKELETEKELLKSQIKKIDVQQIPIESILKHPWLDVVFDENAYGIDGLKNNLSQVIRYILFGKITDKTFEAWRWVDPVTGKQYRRSYLRSREESEEIEARLVNRKIQVNERCSVKLKEMTQEQWDKYRAAFERLACALDEFVSEDWRTE